MVARAQFVPVVKTTDEELPQAEIPLAGVVVGPPAIASEAVDEVKVDVAKTEESSEDQATPSLGDDAAGEDDESVVAGEEMNRAREIDRSAKRSDVATKAIAEGLGAPVVAVNLFTHRREYKHVGDIVAALAMRDPSQRRALAENVLRMCASSDSWFGEPSASAGIDPGASGAAFGSAKGPEVEANVSGLSSRNPDDVAFQEIFSAPYGHGLDPLGDPSQRETNDGD